MVRAIGRQQQLLLAGRGAGGEQNVCPDTVGTAAFQARVLNARWCDGRTLPAWQEPKSHRAELWEQWVCPAVIAMALCGCVYVCESSHTACCHDIGDFDSPACPKREWIQLEQLRRRSSKPATTYDPLGTTRNQNRKMRSWLPRLSVQTQGYTLYAAQIYSERYARLRYHCLPKEFVP